MTYEVSYLNADGETEHTTVECAMDAKEAVRIARVCEVTDDCTVLGVVAWAYLQK
jgi:hypothetical protein